MDTSRLFERGSEAFERDNWQLAIVLWQQLLLVEPDHLDARRLLREAENRAWQQGGRGTPTKLLAVFKALPSILSHVIHMLGKKFDRAMVDCEKALAHDPNSLPMLWGLAAAAARSEHPDVAILTLQYIREKRPTNTKALRRLAHLYEAKEDIARAIDAWSKVKALAPADREAETKLRDLAAVKTMADGRYETSTEADATYRDSLRSEEDAEDREQEHRIIRTEADLERAIERVAKDVEQNPNDKRYVLQLGDLYRRAKSFEKARELYTRAGEIDKMDFSIPERLGETRIEEYEEQQKGLAAQLEASPDNAEARAKLDAVKKERFDFSLEHVKGLVKVRPTDNPLRAKLGDLYYQAGRFEEAAPEYQRAASDPRSRRRCLKLLGLCLYHTGRYQLAASQFEQAIEDGTAASREVRDILYYLAMACEKLEDFERAEAALRKIFEADMSYKDVQQRLERVMRAREARRSKPEDPSENPEQEGETA